MLADKSSFLSSIALSDKESGVLRCLALGLGNRDVCKTLALSSPQLNQIEQNLLDKFCVQNQYHLVKKAFRVWYLDQSNFSLEDVKEKTLDFIEKRQHKFSNLPLSKMQKWELYQLLLGYLREIGELENKKIPPKRD